MAQNQTLIASLLARETRPLDLGGYADAYAGQILSVNVNAPGIIEATASIEKNDFAAYRAVVAALYDLPAEVVAQMDDHFLVWLFAEGTRVYTEFHADLKKKSSDN